MLQRILHKSLCRNNYVTKPATYLGLLRSSSTVSKEEEADPSSQNTEFTKSLSENDEINPLFINRNPRNLEYMGIAKKSKGWRFQYPTRKYYHRLFFKSTGNHTEAYVQHCSGEIVISASTKELCITKHLYSTRDVSAAKNIGRVIAFRCLQSGIAKMILRESELGENSQKFDAFREAIEAGGLELSEPEEVTVKYTPGIDYDDEEELQELYDRQLRVSKLSEDHRIIKELRKIRHATGSITRVPRTPISLQNDNHRIKPV